ncbi:MAG: hypothetical protein HN392_13305 [Anaerolineae bacterium]|jgi:hypothetical protein|nr:hypothetical protein [Anaerolineae bacterium]MBT7075862.1 hypothetical protein [Anaerolineae bacterium]MBT7781609.1 hypothetical protein [Anaerolineae bacterium]
MKRLFEKIMNWIRPKKNLSANSSAMTVQLLQTLAMTKEEEYSCDDVHNLIDEYVEMKRRGEDVEKLMPLVKYHLDMCRGCFDEYEALLAALEFEETI